MPKYTGFGIMRLVFRTVIYHDRPFCFFLLGRDLAIYACVFIRTARMWLSTRISLSGCNINHDSNNNQRDKNKWTRNEKKKIKSDKVMNNSKDSLVRRRFFLNITLHRRLTTETFYHITSMIMECICLWITYTLRYMIVHLLSLI